MPRRVLGIGQKKNKVLEFWCPKPVSMKWRSGEV